MSSGAILFDFDGTLVDARESAWKLFIETNQKFSLGIDTREQFFQIFKGNFFESFAAMFTDKAKMEAAKNHFMALLKTEYHPRLIPGIVDVIKTLSPSHTLVVLTTNSMAVIRRTLEEAGVATCFSHVFSGDVEPSKVHAMHRFLQDQSYGALRHCTPSYVDEVRGDLALDNVFLVTDTSGDVADANKVGITTIGVSWGMHEPAKLRDAGAAFVALWPQELTTWFADWRSARPESCACTGCSGGATSCSTDACTPTGGTALSGHSHDQGPRTLSAATADSRRTAQTDSRLAAAVSRQTPSATQPRSTSAVNTELQQALAGTMRKV